MNPMSTLTLDPLFFEQFKELKSTLEKQRIDKEAQKKMEHNRYSSDHGPMAVACALCGRMVCCNGRYCKEYVNVPNVVRSWIIKVRYPGVLGHQRCEFCCEPRAFNVQISAIEEEVKKYNDEKLKVPATPRE